MDPIEIALRAVGAFYMFGGYWAARAGLVSNLLDLALAGISGKPPPAAERHRTLWLMASTVLVFGGGVALLFLLDLAPVIFAISAIGQFVYLVYLAPRYFDVSDPPDPTGRRQTTNAFFVYLVATTVTIWAATAGHLVGWREVPMPVLWLAGGAIAAHVFYVIHGLRPKSRGLAGGESGAGARPILEPKKILLTAVPDSHPLQAMDDHLYGDVAPLELSLSDGLAHDLAAWSGLFCAAIEKAEGRGGDIPAAELEMLVEDGRSLARRIKLERPDLIVYVEEPGFGNVEITVANPDEAD